MMHHCFSQISTLKIFLAPMTIIVYTYLFGVIQVGILGVIFEGMSNFALNFIQWTYQRCICGMYVCVYVGIIGDFGKMVPIYMAYGFITKTKMVPMYMVNGYIMQTRDFGDWHLSCVWNTWLTVYSFRLVKKQCGWNLENLQAFLKKMIQTSSHKCHVENC